MNLANDEVVNPYNDPDSGGRRGLYIKSPWDPLYVDHIKRHGIKALYFNVAKGWKDSDFSFLETLDGIEELNIIAAKVENFAAVEGVKSLEELNVTAAVKGQVDFRKFDHLNRCYLYWWKGAESILEAPSLDRVYLDKVKLNDWNALAQLERISALTIANSVIPTLNWLDFIKSPPLRELHLLNCAKLSNFTPVRHQTDLRRLTLSGSKNLYDLTFLSNIKDLEVLNLSDNHILKSLSPLRDLKHLKAFAFAGAKTTIEDKDLNPLTDLPELSMLMFGPRKGYSHKLIKKWDWKNFDRPDKLLKPAD